MKMSKKIRTLVSTALISAMVLTMGGMSAFAEEVASNTGVTQVTLTKEVKVASSSVAAPKTSFTFKIAEPTNKYHYTHVDDDGETVEVTQGTTIVYKGELSAVSFDGVTGDSDDEVTIDYSNIGADKYNSEKTAYVDDAKIEFKADEFSKPGLFRYLVKEITPEEKDKYNGMEYDENSYYLDVYVLVDAKNAKFVQWAKVIKINKDGTLDTVNKKDALTFTNTYTTNNLSVQKLITGNQANMTDKFTFTITVSGTDDEEYKTDYTDAQGNPVTFVSGTSRQVTLGHEDIINIYGLSAKDTFTVVEDAANKDGYTTTYKLDDETVASISSEKEETTDHAVVVENNKSVTTPTGIVMTFGPYILLIALAGVFATLFFRRKREEF